LFALLQTAALVLSLFGNDTEIVLRRLESKPELQLRYMKEIMRSAEGRGARRESDDDGFGSTFREKDHGPSVSITPDMCLLYIRLLCKFEPDNVYKYLSSHTEEYPLRVGVRVYFSD
jgi:hypothetical protein